MRRRPTCPPRGAAWAAAVLAAVLAGCAASPEVAVQQIEGVDRCTSIGPRPADPAAPPPTVLDQRIGAEILRVLAAAGHVTTAPSPACWVQHRTVGRTAPAASSGVGVGIGAASGPRGGTSVGIGITLPIGVAARRDTALVIDVVDAARRQQVWVGTLAEALPANPDDADIARAVAAVLARFPPPPP